MFDNLPALAPPKPADLRSEIDHYLSADVEHVTDPLAWWHERRDMYLQLSRMAFDYLTIPGKGYRVITIFIDLFTATSIDVERLFSCGRLLLSHVRSRLSVQSTHTLLCLGMWSKLDLVKDTDVKRVTELKDVVGDDVELVDGWDSIIIN